MIKVTTNRPLFFAPNESITDTPEADMYSIPEGTELHVIDIVEAPNSPHRMELLVEYGDSEHGTVCSISLDWVNGR